MPMILQKIQSAKIVLVLLQLMGKDSSSYRLHSKCRNDLLTCGNELLTCGNELLTCGNELLTRGHNFLSCGKEIKNAKKTVLCPFLDSVQFCLQSTPA